MWAQKHYASIAFFWRGEKKTLPESRQTFEIAAGQTPGLVNPVFSCQTGFFECEHPFTDKPMVITEPTVASTWLLRLVRNCFLGTCRARSTKISSHSRLSGVRQHKRQQRKALEPGWRKSYSVYCENSLSLPVLNWVVVDCWIPCSMFQHMIFKSLWAVTTLELSITAREMVSVSCGYRKSCACFPEMLTDLVISS